MSSSRPIRLLVLLPLLVPGCLIGDDGSGDSGSDDMLAMEEGTAATGSMDGGECFVAPHCDPLAPDCVDGEICSASQGSFDCTPVPEGTELANEGEECGAMSCGEGLVCVAVAVPGCEGGTGCCLPVCDLEQPQCPNGRVCTTFLSEGSTQCYAHVGVCEPE
jgi:hypothetical protein